MAETDGNGENQRVTNAMLKKDIEYLIEQGKARQKQIDEQYDMECKWREIMDERQRQTEIKIAQMGVEIFNLGDKTKGIEDDVDKLQDKIKVGDIWNGVNSLGALIAGILGIKL